MEKKRKTFEDLVNARVEELVNARLEIERSKRLSDIGVLASVVAHELRNPLATISLSINNIKRKANNPDLDKHISNIEKKIYESDQIINNLLFYSKLKPPNLRGVNICNIIESCVKERYENIVSITRKLGPIKDIVIDADSLQIKELFNNILNNACDAVSKENGSIEIIGSDKGKFIEISIHDNGSGISKEDLLRIFDPFFTTKVKGTGLGLSICNQILKFHRGTINIDSEPGKDTTVIVRFPKQAGIS